MNTLELTQYALDNAFGILKQVTADLTQEQADWTPPGIAHSIGALYWHALSSTDGIVHGWCRKQPPLFEQAGWRKKVMTASAPEGEQNSDVQMRAVRVDLPAMHEYAQATAGAVQGWLATLTPEDLEREMETPIGILKLGQMLMVFVAWHLDAHCGEISAMKGCQGVRGYPF